jgi:hypothetical protein
LAKNITIKKIHIEKQMAMKKRKPGMIVMKAGQRLEGMKKIDENYNTIIDYGGPQFPLSSKEINQQIQYCIEMSKAYNESLIITDTKSSLLKDAESKLGDMYSRVLSGCVSKFGSDAIEVSLLGGTRKSERKKPIKNIKQKNIN